MGVRSERHFQWYDIVEAVLSALNNVIFDRLRFSNRRMEASATQGRVPFLNSEAQGLTFCILNEETNEPVESPVAKVLRDGLIVGLANHNVLKSRDGKRLELTAPFAEKSEFLVELAITRIPTNGPPQFTGYLRDVSEQKRVEVYRNARLAATQSLSEARTLDEGAEGVLRAVGESLGWEVGVCWMVNETGTALAFCKAWRRPDLEGMEFETANRNRTFAMGQGLPGQVWSTKKATWVHERGQDVGLPKVASAAQEGLCSSFASPILVGDRVLGVIEFLIKSNREPDADLLEMMGTIAGNFGQFLERKSAEERVRKSEQELADFFDNATVGLHWVGPDGTILRANRAELDLLGYTNEEYIGHCITDFHADADAINDILSRLKAGEQLHEYPARLKCKDGSIKDVLIDTSAMFRDGQFVHSRCFTRDVTERNHTERKLEEAQRRIQAVFNQQFQFMAILAPDGTVLEANETCYRATGVTPEEVLGRPLWETPWWSRLPAMQEQLRRDVVEASLNGGPLFGEMEYSMADGTIRHATAVVTGLKEESGSVTRIVVEGHDDTERRLQEIAIRESEAKFRLMTDTIPQLAWMAHPDGHIFWYNRRWYEYTGTTSEQMEGWGWQSVHDPLVLPRVLERWQTSITNGEPFDMVFPLKGADQQFRPFLTRVNPLKDDNQQVVYWFGTNTDISELKDAREALATNEERLRLALDAGRMGVWDWNIRTGDLNWSESLEPLHGLAPGTFGGTFEDFQTLIHPDDQDMVNKAIQSAVDGNNGYDIEFRNIWSNGSVHWIAGKGKVFTEDDGHPSRMIGICMDVTERVRSEQTAKFLADASAALAVLVDFDSTLQKIASLAVPYFADWVTVDVAEPDGTLRRVAVSHVDPAKVRLAHEIHRQFPPDPAAPQGVWTILRTGHSEIVPEITDELLVQSVQDEQILSILRELGLRSYIGVPLNVRGKTLGVITFIAAESGHRYDAKDLAVAEDLASRAGIAIDNAQLYRELRDADRRKDEFLATLAHELRNPLAPIRNGLQVMRLSGAEGEATAELRTMMERQLNQMVRLVDDLLDVSRITRNKLDLKMERVELATVVQSAVETSLPLIEQSDHTFSVTLPPAPVYLEGDLTRLAQVFSNLLNNSAKYTEPGGRISLAAEAADGEIVVRIRDNGIGIPTDSLSSVFDMFSQVDRNMERAQGGLGIGLTLVQRLVEMHGGKVQAHSDGPAQGSEFTVRLPVHRSGQQMPLADDDASKTATTKRRILIVDDNYDSALSLGMLLKLLGNETRMTHDGLAAVESASEFRPDIILLDIGLPKMNGYDACRRIREESWSNGMVIVALTGWGQEEDRRRSAEAGFDHHLVKPVELSTLQTLLGDA